MLIAPGIAPNNNILSVCILNWKICATKIFSFFLNVPEIICIPEAPINLQLLDYAKDGCKFFNSAGLSLEKVVVEMVTAAQKGKIVVQLVAGDAKEYDENHEQLGLLRSYCLDFEVVYGVS